MQTPKPEKRKDEGIERRLKSKFWVRCIYTQCPECTEIKDGIGKHLVEVYEIVKYPADSVVRCLDCRGEGTQEKECSFCDGTGYVREPCCTCNGKGRFVDCDEDDEPVVLGITSVLVRKKSEN